MNSEIYAYFRLRGLDFEPEEITAKVGIMPTKTWKVGDLINPKIIHRKRIDNGWCLRPEFEESFYLEDYVRYLLEKLEPGWLPLTEICQKYYAEINCVIYAVGDERPAIHFNKEIIEKTAKLNAEIDIDLYFSPDN